MSTVFAERPSFFEGQYLGADDLQAFLKYAREYDARHLLGAHTWGIVAGIELAEGVSPTGEVEYFLTPGVAVDGYGRLLVVTTPYKLTTDLFAQQPSGTVNVWVRYEETPFSGTRASFQSCECSDAFARVAESVVVEVGPRVTVDQRESGVVVDDQSFVDAREALGNPLPNQPLACDGSVAAQTFPDAEARSLWLIPVGQVPWNKVSSSLLTSTEADKKASLIFRRVAGLVTGHIYPTSGVIRLRPRWSTRQAGVSTDQTCALSAIKEADLVTCNGQLNFRELIWLEGNSRFTGDARLYGSRLEFQEPQGTDYLKSGVPLALSRRPDRNEHGPDTPLDDRCRHVGERPSAERPQEHRLVGPRRVEHEMEEHPDGDAQPPSPPESLPDREPHGERQGDHRQHQGLERADADRHLDQRQHRPERDDAVVDRRAPEDHPHDRHTAGGEPDQHPRCVEPRKRARAAAPEVIEPEVIERGCGRTRGRGGPRRAARA